MPTHSFHLTALVSSWCIYRQLPYCLSAFIRLWWKGKALLISSHQGCQCSGRDAVFGGVQAPHCCTWAVRAAAGIPDALGLLRAVSAAPHCLCWLCVAQRVWMHHPPCPRQLGTQRSSLSDQKCRSWWMVIHCIGSSIKDCLHRVIHACVLVVCRCRKGKSLFELFKMS